MGYNSILIVDDEVEICEKMAAYFELEDFNVKTATSGNMAIDILKTNSKIELIISDIKMPDGDGLKLLDFVKNDLEKNVPVVMLSAFTENTEEELIKRGALKLICKPIDLDELINYIKSLS